MATDRSLRLLDKLVSEGSTAFTASEIQDALELSPQATSNVLGRLVEAGLVDRVTSGRYAIRQIGTLGTAAFGMTSALPSRPSSPVTPIGSAI